jgi:hypothetical protein
MEESDDATVKFIKPAEFPPSSPDLNPLHFHVWNEFEQLGYKSQRERFQSL